MSESHNKTNTIILSIVEEIVEDDPLATVQDLIAYLECSCHEYDLQDVYLINDFIGGKYVGYIQIGTATYPCEMPLILLPKHLEEDNE